MINIIIGSIVVIMILIIILFSILSKITDLYLEDLKNITHLFAQQHEINAIILKIINIKTNEKEKENGN